MHLTLNSAREDMALKRKVPPIAFDSTDNIVNGEDPSNSKPRDTKKTRKDNHKPHPIRPGTTTKFKDCDTLIAVDISTSTAENVLSKEKEAVALICGILCETARKEVEILPWSGRVRPILDIENTDSLDTFWGTNP